MTINAFNGLVSLRNQVDRAWANIDVILKQRHDVIPQLISICEQFTNYERGTFDHLIAARGKYNESSTRDVKMKADQETTMALKGVIAIGEAYPTLKSSEQFNQIQITLSNLENQLADRRELYNEQVTNFNTRTQQFPDLFFAQMMMYHILPLYRIDVSETSMPSLKMKFPA
jgi:LemA protein